MNRAYNRHKKKIVTYIKNSIKKAYGLVTRKRYRIILFFLILIVFFILVIPPSKPLFVNDYSTIIQDKDGKILRVFLNSNEQWLLPPQISDTIPYKLKKAVTIYEDQYFDYHPGVNPFSLFRAAYQNLKAGRIVSGASTLTMQVSRLRKPKDRNLFNKIVEIVDAVRIECHHSKRDILKRYLDHAPYGGNIAGYQAASHRYFGKTPEKLTWSEAATLAVLPNAPGLISPSSDTKKLLQKRNLVLEKLLQNQVIDTSAYQLSRMEKIPKRVLPFNLSAPHLTRRLNKQLGNTENIIRTTLDNDLQQMVSGLTTQHLNYLSQWGISNGAVLVAETQTGKVRSYIGSKKFFDHKTDGQVDGVISARSSGSLLKPFLYALCMDEGIILPQTLIKDIPTYFDAFSPMNANETFMGVVSAKNALIRSLNVPAVRLLNTYGLHQFYAFLQTAGLSTLFRTADDYGLPLIIGGAEVTLWDMAYLFRGLGHYGKFAPLYVLKKGVTGSPEHSASLISQGASYLTLDILRELNRPGTEHFWKQYSNQKPIAWKTGTSYGHKDAWAVGVSPQWTIAVWIGNFSGEENVNLSGKRSAGPLLFQIFNRLPHDPALKWFERPRQHLTQVEICRETGFLAGDHCNHTTYTDAPLNMKPLKMCPYHRGIFVDKQEQYRVCSKCWKEGHHEKDVLIYPPRVSSFLRSRGQITYSLPSHEPSCPATHQDKTLSILYPEENARIWMPSDFHGKKQKLILHAAHSKKESALFWYLDQQYLGKTNSSHKQAVALTPGRHTLYVIDKDGNHDQVTFFTQGRE